MARGGKSGERVELQPPSHAWISWAILIAYIAVFVEGVILNLTHVVGDPVSLARLTTAQFHICSIYAVEAAMAVGPGWCAMSPGWTCKELLAHHVPYAMAAGLTILGGHTERWAAPMLVVLLTPLNEGLFIVCGLGAPAWLAKVRRLFGFCIILAQLYSECAAYVRAMLLHWSIGVDTASNVVVDQLVWGGIYYHAELVRMYIRRWQKTRAL